MGEQTAWVAVKDVCCQYGYSSYEYAKRKIRDETFPVPTYKVGKLPVIDRGVHEAYFRKKRDVGLAALDSMNG